MINKRLHFNGLNIRIPLIIPTQGAVIHEELTVGDPSSSQIFKSTFGFKNELGDACVQPQTLERSWVVLSRGCKTRNQVTCLIILNVRLLRRTPHPAIVV